MNSRELLIFAGLCLVWGFHFVVIKTAVSEAPPIFYAAMRMTLVAAVMSPFLRWRPGQMGRLVAGGVCFASLNYALFFTGISMAPASAAALALELHVPFATLLGVFFLNDRFGWRRGVGILLAIAGVAVIALSRKGGEDGPQSLFGIGLVATGAMVEAMGAVIVKKISGVRPPELLAWFSLVGLAPIWLMTLAFEHGQAEAFAAADKTLLFGAIAYSALGASVFGHTAYYYLLQRLPLSVVAPSNLLITLIAVVFAVILLGDPVTPRLIIGGSMVIAGVGVILLRNVKKQSTLALPPEPPS